MATTERDLLDRLVNPEDMGGTAALLGASLTPGVSTAVDAASALNAIRNRDALGLGISALGLLPFVSGTTIRTGGKAAGKGIRSLLDIQDVHRATVRDKPYRTFADEYFSVIADSEAGRVDFPFMVRRVPRGYHPHYGYAIVPKEKQFDLFPLVDLEVTIPPWTGLEDSVGRGGIRSIGRAVIEDFDKATGGAYRVGDLIGDRITGVHRGREHVMKLPRSFFFKQ
jgi:hypothetical protein